MTKIIEAVEAKAQYIREEIHAEFHRFESGVTMLTPQVIQVFEDKWLKACADVDRLVLAANLSPQSQYLVARVEKLAGELKDFVGEYAALLAERYGVPAQAVDGETEKERKRRERKQRMARFQRGEGI